MKQLDDLLSRLQQVKKTGSNAWKACCPAHDDRSPSMGVKMGYTGGILVHCFAGCSAYEIVSAVGMELSDLFPDEIQAADQLVRGNRRAFSARDAIGYVAKQALYVAACCVVIREQGFLPEADKLRLMDTAGRLQGIAEEVL